MLHPKGGGWHNPQAKVPPPGVSRPGFFDTVTHNWTELATYPRWLSREVRAASSVPVRTGTGSLWSSFLLLSGPQRLLLSRQS